MRQTVFVLVTAIVMFTTSYLPAQVIYDLTDLGEGAAYSINNSGQVVGTAEYPSWELPDGNFVCVPHAVLFDSTGDGNNIDLGEGIAYCINNSGQIVGQFGVFVGHLYAALFNPTNDGNNFDLRILSDNYSRAFSINDNGQIVGYAGGAVLFDPTGDGNNIYMGDGSATSINNNGQIVGRSNASFFLPSSATLFDPSGAGNNIILDPNVSLWTDHSEASSINNSGQIVGYAGSQGSMVIINPTPVNSSDSFYGSVETSTTTVQSNYNITAPFSPMSPVSIFNLHAATLFDPTGDGNNVDMGTLPGGNNSCAYSINNKGQIVGYAFTASHEKHAAMFDSTGGGDNVDLNELIASSLAWTLTEARCINDNGCIVGQMTNSSGDEHAFLLTLITPRKLAIVSIEDAIAEKHEAIVKIDAALEEEWTAVDAMDEMRGNWGFWGLSRRELFKARFRLFISIMREMRSKAELQSSVKQLEMSLESLKVD